jgi:CubicO group peptidase (beta-lactamase class C family)
MCRSFWLSISVFVTITMSFGTVYGIVATADPMTLSSSPNATAVHDVGSFFADPSVNSGGSDSAWQNGSIFPDAKYQYSFMARDKSFEQGVPLLSGTTAATTRLGLLKGDQYNSRQSDIASVISPQLLHPIPSVYIPAVETARSNINTLLSDNSATSATVSIMDNGQIVYSEQFGIRDRAQSLPVDDQTQFNIGSISKIFTAAAMLTLVDQGLVELDLPVTTYLPQFNMPQDLRYQDITVRMLLNHSSGMPGTNFRKGFGSQKNLDYSGETLDYLTKSTLKHGPGVLSVYCNDGFTLSKALIEQVTGIPYGDYLQQKIFTPLNMGRTSCFFAEGNGNIAQIFGESDQPLPAEYVSAMGTGGISSITDDLCRFSTILYSNSNLLSPGSMVEYRKAQYGPETGIGERPLLNFGLGWDYTQVREFTAQNITVLAKSGGTIRFSSFIMVAPEEKLTVAVLFAGAGIDTADVTSNIMQALLEGKKIVPKYNQAPPVPENDVIPGDVLPFAGIYGSSGALMKFTFNTDTNTLETHTWEGQQFVYSESAPYKVDGYFHSGSGSKFWFKEYGKTKYLLNAIGENYVSHIVTAEHITLVASSLTGAAFDNKTWLFRNAENYGFILDVPVTETITELPGYITLDGVAYALQSETSAEMALRYGRDLVTIQLQDVAGEQWLSTGNFVYSSADTVLSLTNGGETIGIGQDGWNEWRKITNQGTIACSIPANGRMMIFSQDKEVIFDTLTSTTLPFVVPGGSYVVFIGNPGDSFVVTISN